jgi:hypothetical protein
LEDALRSVVQDELRKTGVSGAPPPAPAAEHKATKLDLLVLAVVAADCALVLVLYPAVGNTSVQNFIKVMQWTGGTVFVAAATWFQKQFLEFTRTRPFRWIASVILLVLLPQQVPVIPILNPRAGANVISLGFDDDVITKSGGRRLVTATSHVFSTVTSEKCAVKDQPITHLRLMELWSAIETQRVVPVFFNANLVFPENLPKNPTLMVRASGHFFTPAEIEQARMSVEKSGSGHLSSESTERQLQVDVKPETSGSLLTLADAVYDLAIQDAAHKCLARVCGPLSKLLDADCSATLAVDTCKERCP